MESKIISISKSQSHSDTLSISVPLEPGIKWGWNGNKMYRLHSVVGVERGWRNAGSYAPPPPPSCSSGHHQWPPLYRPRGPCVYDLIIAVLLRPTWSTTAHENLLHFGFRCITLLLLQCYLRKGCVHKN